MLKQNSKNAKCKNLDYIDDYRAMTDINNPYSYDFGRAGRVHAHTNDFNRFQNRMNKDYYCER